MSYPAQHVHLVPLKNPAKLTKWIAPHPVTKQLGLDADNNLEKRSTASQLYTGSIERLELYPSEFIHTLTTLGANDCLSYAQPLDTEAKRVLSCERFAADGQPSDATTRTAANMVWPSGIGILLGDYDPQADHVLPKQELLEAYYVVCPALREAAHVWGASTSSCLYDETTGDEIRGVAGQRVYMFVANGTDIPRAGLVLFKRLCLAGHLHIKISSAGSMLVRSIIDHLVWQTNRIDYCAPPTCEPPLASRKPAPVLLGNANIALDTELALPDLTEAEESAFQQLVTKATTATAPEAARVRDAYIEKRIAKLVGAGIDAELAERTIRSALETSVLYGDFPLTCTDGTLVTVADLLANCKCYHNQTFCDPIEPDYHDDHRIARATLLGVAQPYIHSFAHGGCRYILSLQPETVGAGIAHPDIAELNVDHFVSRESGKTFVFREKHDEAAGRRYLERLTPKDVFDFYRNRKIATGIGKQAKVIGLGDYWLDHTDRRQYNDVVFAPNQETPGSYNLWRGFSVEPKQGDWSLMQYHIKVVICADNDELNGYTLGWMASAIQHPDRQGEVALVMQGSRGTGKGTFAHAVGRLFGQHYMQITQASHLVGNFNAHLRDCVLLFADEAFWAGDHKSENVLKALVTEPRLVIEPKGINAFTVPNYLHIMIASNNDWVIPAGERERRYCVYTVSGKHAQDTAYFTALRQELESGGLAAMLYDLQHMDLSNFNLRKVPFTTGLREQMLYSLTPEKRWWYEELMSGDIWAMGNKVSRSSAKIPQYSFPREDLQSMFADRCKHVYAGRGSETALGMLLPKVLPTGWPQDFRTAASEISKGQRYYVFPTLDVARKHFEELTGLHGEFDACDEGGAKSNLTNLDNLSCKLRKVK